MILCSCNVLTSTSLRAAAQALQDADPSRPVTPGRVFHAVGARPQCGSCIELVRKSLQEWGFPLTCPEPLASIANDQEDASSDQEPIEWDMV